MKDKEITHCVEPKFHPPTARRVFSSGFLKKKVVTVFYNVHTLKLVIESAKSTRFLI